MQLTLLWRDLTAQQFTIRASMVKGSHFYLWWSCLNPYSRCGTIWDGSDTNWRTWRTILKDYPSKWSCQNPYIPKTISTSSRCGTICSKFQQLTYSHEFGLYGKPNWKMSQVTNNMFLVPTFPLMNLCFIVIDMSLACMVIQIGELHKSTKGQWCTVSSITQQYIKFVEETCFEDEILFPWPVILLLFL